MAKSSPALQKSPPSSRVRAWAFRLILLLGAPLAFFLVLEGGLRLAGFGHDPSFFIKDPLVPGWYRTNPRFTELFLPASFGLKPVNFRLARAKPAGTKRVFVLGESAAMGVPEPAFGLAPQLQFHLRASLGGEHVEVYNLGVTAINSHAVRRILDEALEFEPDLLVIYMGNNEVVGPYGPGAVVTRGVLPLPLIRASLWVRGTRTGQLLQALAARFGRGGGGFRDWRGMEMFVDKAVPADDPRLSQVYGNFGANLEAMLASAHRAGVKVVLSTVAVNVRDCAPFVSKSAASLSSEKRTVWEQAWTEGRRAEAAGDLARARKSLGRAVEIDPGHAGGQYLLAETLEAAGDDAAAREHYFAALQQDALRFRGDATINRLIREAAERDRDNVKLVDAAKALGADVASSAPLAGRAFFFEHVHLTWEGNRALSQLLASAASSALSPAGAGQHGYSEGSDAAAVGFSEAGRLAMLRRMDELNGRPPFTGQVRYAADRTRLARQIAASEEALAKPGAMPAIAAKLNAALALDPENPSLLFQVALITLQGGDHEGALRLLDRLAAVQPFSAESAALRAVALQGAGRRNEAEAVLQQAIAEEPYYFQSYLLLARLWVETGRASQATRYFAELLERMPDSRSLRSTYAQLFAADGYWPLAETQWREVLRLVPDDESALAPLLKHLVTTNRNDDALALMRQAHAYNPRSFANNQRLVEYYDSRNDREQTVAFMQDLAESGPVNALLFRDLALNLEKLGRRPEMRDALLRGRRIAKEEGENELLAEFDRQLQKP